MSKKKNKSKKLASTDVWEHIHKRLSPEDSEKLAEVTKQTHKASKKQSVWRERLVRDFPHYYDWYKNDIENREFFDYREFYIVCYERDYEKLSDSEKRLFSWAKLGDLTSLKKYNPIPSELYVQDANGLNIIQWAIKNKHKACLNYFFDVLNRGTEKQKKRKFLSNAIRCHIDLDQYEDLVYDEKAAFVAVKYGNMQALENILLQDPELLNVVDKKGHTLLYLAARKDQVEVVRFLLSQGLEDRSVFYIAQHFNHYDIMDVLIENDQSILEQHDARYHGQGFTPLLRAVAKKDYEMVDYLLYKGADTETRGTGYSRTIRGGLLRNVTALHLSAMSDDAEMAKLLISYGANLGATEDVRNFTAAHIAINNKNWEMLKLFLNADSDRSVFFGKEDTFLAMLHDEQIKQEVLKYIIEEKVPLNKNELNYCLWFAVNQNDAEKVKYFLDQGADPYRNDLIFKIVEKNNLDILNIMFEYEKNLLESDPESVTIKLKDMVNNNGETLLFGAIRNGNQMMISYLISKGINPLKRNTRGRTPLSMARDRNFYNEADLALDHLERAVRLYKLKQRYEKANYGRLRFFGKTMRYSSEEKLNTVNHLMDLEANGHTDTSVIDSADKTVLRKAPALRWIYKEVKDELEKPEGGPGPEQSH